MHFVQVAGKYSAEETALHKMNSLERDYVRPWDLDYIDSYTRHQNSFAEEDTHLA